MTRIATAPLEPRDVEAIIRDVRDRVPAYVPGWRPATDGAGDALVQVYARFLADGLQGGLVPEQDDVVA